MSDLAELLIDGYLGGINKPSAEQAGFAAFVNDTGTNLVYLPSPKPHSTFHVEDYGAVPIQLGDDQDQANVPLRTANTAAIQAALDAALAAKGGTVLFGSGIYLTNGQVGYDRSDDINANVIIQGVSAFTEIRSNNYTQPTFVLATTGGNIRGITMRDLVIRGGREGLSLRWCAYSRFERIWFWGSKQWGLQDEAGNGNVFLACRFDEGAQGIGTGVEADAALFISCEETVACCNFGEYSGGIIINDGVVNIVDCLFHDCQYRGAATHSYLSNTDFTLGGGELLTRTASITIYGGVGVIKGCTGSVQARFVLAFRADELVMNGGRVQSVSGGSPGFQGFIEVYTGGGTVAALNVTGCTFTMHTSGFFIKDVDAVLHDSIVQAQVITYPTITMTAISSSAPKLLNPGTENNLLQLKTFAR